MGSGGAAGGAAVWGGVSRGLRRRGIIICHRKNAISFGFIICFWDRLRLPDADRGIGSRTYDIYSDASHAQPVHCGFALLSLRVLAGHAVHVPAAESDVARPHLQVADPSAGQSSLHTSVTLFGCRPTTTK